MKWTLFVLDFDNTYDLTENDENGVQPIVYLVPTDKIPNVIDASEEAHDSFHSDDNPGLCIGDSFEEFLESKGIDYRRVGDIDLTFGERAGSYLSDEIELAVV